MSASIWDVLGITETTDERAIKRAYAARLKITSPESDAAGYMKLRDAYEAAKNHAAFLRVVTERQELPPEQTPEVPDAAPAPDIAAVEISPASHRQQALADLQSLLSENKPDDFLKKIEAIQAAQTFVTLDEQNDFIGEVARLVYQTDIGDVHWRGQLAAMLGARERDNIFAVDSEYWHAYDALLECYTEARNVATREHAQARTQAHDEIAARPGYLHVYYVLTAPFDSERLMALTRSQNYHRLAEFILQRSKSDPAIVIPAENREWWERTRMAGQHRPTENQPEITTSAPPAESTRFPFWMIWIVLMLCMQGARMCSGSSHTQFSQDQTRRIYENATSNSPPPMLAFLAKNEALMSEVESCDPQTRARIVARIYRVQQSANVVNPSSAANSNPAPLTVSAYASDPEVALLLSKCPADSSD